MHRPISTLVALVLAMLSAPLPLAPAATLRFGPKGHHVVGFLADAHLAPATKEALAPLIGRSSLAWSSTWADAIRDEQPETGPWHYVNVPEDADRYDRERDCPDGACVVERIEASRRLVADAKADRLQRLHALKWLVHLVGDLHQPLHCAHAKDRGGNEIKVTFEGRPVNLHEFWDTTLLERQHLDDRGYADALLAALAPERAASWRAGTPAEWATESLRICREQAYRDERGEPLARGDVLSRTYFTTRTVVVDEQLQKAGVRLAWLLDEAFAPAASESEAESKDGAGEAAEEDSPAPRGE